ARGNRHTRHAAPDRVQPHPGSARAMMRRRTRRPDGRRVRVRALADKFGRKSVLIGCVLFFGLASLASAYSSSLWELVALRFLTGLGLGGAMPNSVTLTSEFCPDKRRSFLVTTMFCGFTVGSALGG